MTSRTRHWLHAAAAVPITTVLAAGCATPSGSPARPAASLAVSALSSPALASGPGSASGAARDNRSAGTSRRYQHGCAPSQLRLTLGPLVSEMTEQHTVIIVLRNISARGCSLQGYPAITLTAGDGKTLPFSYRRQGDQMLTGSPPAAVPLSPGGAAYLAFNKNACVGPSTAAARQAQVTPPGTHEPLTITLSTRQPEYCGPHDPGHTIDVIPVQRTLAAVYAGP